MYYRSFIAAVLFLIEIKGHAQVMGTPPFAFIKRAATAANLVRTDFPTSTAGDGGSVTSASFTPPDNSLLVVVAMAQSQWSGGASISNATISDTASLTWTSRVVQDNSGIFATDLRIWTAPVTTGVAMTVTIQKQIGDFDSQAWVLRPIAYSNYKVSSPTGVTGASGSGPTDGPWTPMLTGTPSANSEVLAVIAGTIAYYDDVFVSAGAGWSEVFSRTQSGYYVLQAQARSGSTVDSVNWADTKSAASNDDYYEPPSFVALEIKAGP